MCELINALNNRFSHCLLCRKEKSEEEGQGWGGGWGGSISNKINKKQTRRLKSQLELEELLLIQ